jgi:hypothetical protein
VIANDPFTTRLGYVLPLVIEDVPFRGSQMGHLVACDRRRTLRGLGSDWGRL